jgi:hypothetical protein
MNYLDLNPPMIRQRGDAAGGAVFAAGGKAAGKPQAAFGTVTHQQLDLAERDLAAAQRGALASPLLTRSREGWAA